MDGRGRRERESWRGWEGFCGLRSQQRRLAELWLGPREEFRTFGGGAGNAIHGAVEAALSAADSGALGGTRRPREGIGSVVFLTPNLPPVTCGLADHSANLAKALARLGWSVGVVALRGDPAIVHRQGWGEAARLWGGSCRGLARQLSELAPEWLWVQLSGYGYSRWGSPWLLCRALEYARRRMTRLKVAVCVHETHCAPSQLGAKGPILSFLQRWTIGRVARLGDVVFPTTAAWAERCVLDYGVPAARVQVLPIAANVPAVRLSAARRRELRRKLGLGLRECVAVTFGRWASQRAALERLGRPLQLALAAGSLDRVLAVGGESPSAPPEVARFFAGIPWKDRLLVLGPQPAERVGEVLALADIGLVPAPWGVWEKSGAARAFQQAGLTLWIFDEGAHKVLEAGERAPTWEEIAQAAAGRLQRESLRQATDVARTPA